MSAFGVSPMATLGTTERSTPPGGYRFARGAAFAPAGVDENNPAYGLVRLRLGVETIALLGDSPTIRGFSPELPVHLNLPFSSPPTASMTPAEIRDEIIDILEDISPDEDLDGLDDQKPFRDQLELDSMDFLDIVMELLRKRHRVQIPEEDYGHLASMHFDRHLPRAQDERPLSERSPGQRPREFRLSFSRRGDPGRDFCVTSRPQPFTSFLHVRYDHHWRGHERVSRRYSVGPFRPTGVHSRATLRPSVD